MGFMVHGRFYLPRSDSPPLFTDSSKRQRLLSLCIGIYYIIILFASLAGNFPVPVHGIRDFIPI